MSATTGTKRDRQEFEQKDIKDENVPPKSPEQSQPRKKRKLNDGNEKQDAKQDEPTEQIEEGKIKKTDAAPVDEAVLKEMKRLKSKHRELLKEGYKCVVGVDEAGRGPLAGPVVIAAAFVPIDTCITGITDSKKINEESEREKLYEEIMQHKEIKWSVAVLDHEQIDEYNILEASMMGMRECVQKLHDALVEEGELGVDYALADGNRDPLFEHPKDLKYEYITKGDGNVYCIGAASIVAKVTRDRMMFEYDKLYPLYKLAQNKGYPTPFHKQCVISKGPCEIHRKSFRPVKDWYKKHKPEIHKEMEELKKKTGARRKKEKLELQKRRKAGSVKDTQSISNFFSKKKKAAKTKAKKTDKKKAKAKADKVQDE